MRLGMAISSQFFPQSGVASMALTNLERAMIEYREVFARQIAIPDIGLQGQERLLASRVLVVGAGGLASPVVTYLASAGVGTLIIADGDDVALSNLNRQFLHGIGDVGSDKAESAARSARLINGATTVIALKRFLSAEDLDGMLFEVDCVVDCVDDYEARTMVGRACLKAGVPLIEAGVRDLYGWLLCVDRAHACLECTGLRDIACDSSPAVLGASVGVIGSLQALSCIKVLLGSDDVGFGRLVTFDGRLMEMETVELARDGDCPAHNLV